MFFVTSLTIVISVIGPGIDLPLRLILFLVFGPGQDMLNLRSLQ